MRLPRRRRPTFPECSGSVWQRPSRDTRTSVAGMAASRFHASCTSSPSTCSSLPARSAGGTPTKRSVLAHFRVRAAQKGAHISDAIGAARAQHSGVARELGNMVRLGGAIEAYLPQGLHHLVHVHVAIVGEGLDKMRQRSGHIAEMHFEDLAAAAKIANHLEDVLAHLAAALRPCSDAERETPVAAAGRDLLGPVIAVVMGEDLGNTIHLREWRGVRMQRQLHTGFLRDRQHSLHKVGVVGPYVVGRVLALETLFLDFVAKVIEVELASRIAAPLDHVRRIGVRGMKIVRGYRNAELPDVAQEAAVGLDVLVSAG